jgi:hypothetical protein
MRAAFVEQRRHEFADHAVPPVLEIPAVLADPLRGRRVLRVLVEVQLDELAAQQLEPLLRGIHARFEAGDRGRLALRLHDPGAALDERLLERGVRMAAEDQRDVRERDRDPAVRLEAAVRQQHDDVAGGARRGQQLRERLLLGLEGGAAERSGRHVLRVGGDQPEQHDAQSLDLDHVPGARVGDRHAAGGALDEDVGAEHREPRGRDQLAQVVAAEVVLVVADHRRVEAEPRQEVDGEAALGLVALERALEPVAGVGQHDLDTVRGGGGALALHVAGERSGAADELRRRVGGQAFAPQRFERAELAVEVVDVQQHDVGARIVAGVARRAGGLGQRARREQQRGEPSRQVPGGAAGGAAVHAATIPRRRRTAEPPAEGDFVCAMPSGRQCEKTAAAS